MTAQLSKVVEHAFASVFIPWAELNNLHGPNQFAYAAGRGARDALAMLTLKWLEAVAKGKRVGVYCSDVSGAFDRVEVERLIAIRSGHPHRTERLTACCEGVVGLRSGQPQRK